MNERKEEEEEEEEEERKAGSDLHQLWTFEHFI